MNYLIKLALDYLPLGTNYILLGFCLAILSASLVGLVIIGIKLITGRY